MCAGICVKSDRSMQHPFSIHIPLIWNWFKFRKNDSGKKNTERGGEHERRDAVADCSEASSYISAGAGVSVTEGL